ncbi:MAG: hypothetical protein ACRYFZ_18745 [Janthinobacterium lividum]
MTYLSWRTVVLSGLAALFTAGCANNSIHHHGDEVLFRRFARALQPPPGTKSSGTYRLNLAEVTPFAWDSVYFFTGNPTPASDYGQYTLGPRAWFGPQAPAHCNRLFFVRQGKVISFIDCPKRDNLAAGEKSLNITLVANCHGNYPVLAYAQAQLLAARSVHGAVTDYILVPADSAAGPAPGASAPN